jgi:hypothetical protein
MHLFRSNHSILLRQLSGLITILLTAFLPGRAQTDSLVLDSIVKTVRLGDDSVHLKVFSTPGLQRVYAHVHENEEAALAAGKRILAETGGKLITLRHSFAGPTNRNIRFNYRQTQYEFDPNRIYTANDSVLESGIRVVKGRGKVNQEVKGLVRNLADTIWSELRNFPLIVAIHNNKNTPPAVKNLWFFWCQSIAESFNVTSYVMRSDFASDSNKSCEDIYINPRINNSEFFIVTQRNDFIDFFQKRYNVVLQNPTPVDDGSMSVFATQHGIRYINSEAKMGRMEEQLAMLRLVSQSF